MKRISADCYGLFTLWGKVGWREWGKTEAAWGECEAPPHTFFLSFSPNKPLGLIINMSSTTMYGAMSLKPSGK